MDDNKKIEELEARIAVLEDKLDFLYGIGRSEKLGAYLKKMKRISAAAQFLAESLDRPEIAKQVEEIQREELRKNFDVDDAQEAQEYVDEANKLYNEENKKLNDIIENLKNNDMNAVAGHDPSVSGVGSEEVSQLVKNSDIMYGYKRSSETVGLLKDENSLFDFSDSNDAWMEAYSNLDDDDYDEYDNYDLTNNTAESMPAPVAQPETKPEPVQESEPESPYITTNKPKKKKSPKVAETDANLFEFLETDGGLKLIVYKGTDEKNIVIPASVGGTDVVEIGDSSISSLHGMEKAKGHDYIKNWVAVIGDSTFMHTGLNSLVNMYYNQSHGTVIILDNRTTGMTGHQDHPGTGKTLSGETVPAVHFPTLIKGIGIQNVKVVNPFDTEELTKVLKEETQKEELSVIIAQAPCALLKSEVHPYKVQPLPEKCVHCGACLQPGCPALTKNEDGSIRIDATMCNGCGLCMKMCRFGALEQVKA